MIPNLRVDSETLGERQKFTFRWLYENKVIPITNREGSQKTTASIICNPKTGEGLHVGADSKGPVVTSASGPRRGGFEGLGVAPYQPAAWRFLTMCRHCRYFSFDFIGSVS